ncbi:MAG: DNA polymerase III subunit gamma/tau [Acidobacteria bacterium]|nr:DNA polymerase III subunit gamma/tau [Acidobacteriota bacterium]
MAYQVLARKWRPQDFSTLIGQQPVVTALRNALAEGRIAHAYLFAGIRGVGKTSVARVFAKALNCEQGLAAGPCNACRPCLEITAGSDLDVLEIDAATYSKVEQIRDLTESLRYGPARDRYKIVVLDEVHRLSRQAFDALLKIVEEPPPRLIFIFATTEIDAVPATILSRCQEYHFRRVSAQEVATHLAAICAAEGISASPAALRLVARAGEGSVRDAVALLDQLATFGAGTVDDEEAARLLGGLDTALFHELLGAIVAGRAADVLAAAARVTEEGWDPRQVYSHFLAYVRDALRLALGTDPEQIDLPLEEARALAALATEAGYENLLRVLHLLLQGETAVRRAEAGTLACEVTWLRAAELPKLVRLEELLGGGAPPAPRPRPGPGPSARPSRVPRPESAAPRPVAAPPRPAPSPPPPAAPEPEPSHPAAPEADAELTRVLEELSRRRPSLAAQVESCARREGQTLVLAVGSRQALVANGIQRDSNRRLLDEAVAAAWGPGATWRFETGAEESEPVAAAAPPPEAVLRAAQEPAVQAVLEIFGGEIRAVEPPEAPEA